MRDVDARAELDDTETPPAAAAGTDGERQRYRLRPAQLRAARRAFMARHLDPARVACLVRGPGVRPRIGDYVLARVLEIGRHRRLETETGRRAELQPGDEVVLVYGARYAPDQFRGEVPSRLGPCHLLAAGGLAGRCTVRHAGVKAPTRIVPLGLLADERGRVWNTRDTAPLAGADPRLPDGPRPLGVVVAGTAMNAGKTTTAAALVRGWRRLGLAVGAVKASGTASAGDRFAYLDAGAEVVLDPSDRGLPSTADVPWPLQWETVRVLVAEAVRRGVERLVVEVADGFLFEDSARLVEDLCRSAPVRGLLLAAADAAGALAGAAWAREHRLPLLAVSGALTLSPLAMEECRHRLDVPVIPPARLEETVWLPDDVLAPA